MSTTTELELEEADCGDRTIIATGEDEGAHAGGREIHGIKWFVLVFAVLSSAFLFALDNTVVANVQPVIIRDLGHIEKLPWISVAYVGGSFATILTWAKLFGLFEMKTLFISSVILFEAGSALCGAAPMINALIIGRAICGVGSGGMYLGSMTTLSVFTTIEERALYLSYIAITWGLGTVVGPLVGGAFADSSATWRWSFYINLVVGLLAVVAYIFLLPSFTPFKERTFLEKVKRLDYVGSLLFIGSSLTMFMAISFGGVIYPWSNARVISLFVLSAVLWAAFALQQARALFTTRAFQIFPVNIATSWEMVTLFVQDVCGNMAAIIPVYFLPLFYQFERGSSTIQAGIYLLPFVSFFISAILLNGVLLGKTPYFWWYIAGGICIIAGSAPLMRADPTTPAAQVYGLSILIALGAGLFVQASFAVAQAKVAAHAMHDALALIMCAEYCGLSLTLAIANSVFLNEAQDGIQALLPAAPLHEIQATISGVGTGLVASLSAQQREEVLAQITDAIGNVYGMAVAAGAMTLVLSLTMKRERLLV